MKAKKSRIHLSLSAPVLTGIRAVAALEGRDVCDVFDELGRAHLSSLGITPAAIRELIEDQIREVLAAQKGGKKFIPTVTDVEQALAKVAVAAKKAGNAASPTH